MRKRPVFAAACNTLLLLLALAAVAEGFVSAYGLEVVPEWLWTGVALAGVGFGVLWALPKYKRYLVPGFLGVWGCFVLKFWDVPAWGEVSVRCHVVNTIAAKVPGVTWLQPVAPPPGVPGVGEGAFPALTAIARELRGIQCVTWWMLAVGAVYALLLGWVVAGGRFIPGFLMTLAPILPAVCVTEAPSPLGVGLLLTVWGTMALRSLSCRTAGKRGAAVTPYALAASALAVAMVMHLLPVEGRTQGAWASQIREDVIQGAYRLDLSRLGSFFGRTGSGSTEYVSLSGNGPGYTGRTALRVHTDSPGKHYLRGWSSDVYTGRSWEPLGREAKEELRTILEQEDGEEPLLKMGETIEYWNEQGIRQPWSSIYIPVGAGEEEPSFMEVENVSAPGGALYYPYALAGYPQGVEAGLDSHLEGERGVYKYSFEFYPNYALWTDLISTGTGEGPYRDFVYANELQVPEETRELLMAWLDESVGELGVSLMGVRSPEDYARLLNLMISGDGDDGAYIRVTGEEYYRYKGVEYDITHGLPRELLDAVEITPEEVETYRLNYASLMTAVVDEVLTGPEGELEYDAAAPAPPAGEDYVAHFLETKRGYCMHFATTATLLLRSLGVPARYVGGYVVNVPRTGYAVVPDRAAHAWVEVWIDGVGWYPMDFTPGFEGEGTGPTESGEFAETSPTPEPTPSPSPTPTAAPTPSAAPSATPTEKPEEEPGGPSEVEKAGLSPAVWGPLLGLLGAVLVLYALKKRRIGKLRGPDTNAAVLYAWKLHRRLEKFGCSPDGRLEELGKKAKFSQHTLTGEERSEALDILERDRRRTFRRKRGGEG